MTTILDTILAEYPHLAEMHNRLALAESLATWIHRMEVIGQWEQQQRKSDD